MGVSMFKVGDKVVLLTLALGNAYLWKVVSIDGCMIEISQTGQPNEWVHFSEIKSATTEEIAAGHRVYCEVLDMVDVSPNCEVRNG